MRHILGGQEELRKIFLGVELWQQLPVLRPGPDPAVSSLFCVYSCRGSRNLKYVNKCKHC